MYTCPKCSSDHVETERRPNGDSTCLACKHKDKTKNFIHEMTPSVEKEELGDVPCNNCGVKFSEHTELKDKVTRWQKAWKAARACPEMILSSGQTEKAEDLMSELIASENDLLEHETKINKQD